MNISNPVDFSRATLDSVIEAIKDSSPWKWKVEEEYDVDNATLKTKGQKTYSATFGRTRVVIKETFFLRIFRPFSATIFEDIGYAIKLYGEDGLIDHFNEDPNSNMLGLSDVVDALAEKIRAYNAKSKNSRQKQLIYPARP